MPVPGPKDAPVLWTRCRVVIACSRIGCTTTFTWLGAHRPASPDADATDRGHAIAAAGLLGWTFPPTGNVCPRPHPEEGT